MDLFGDEARGAFPVTIFYPSDPILQNLIANAIWALGGVVLWTLRNRLSTLLTNRFISPSSLWFICIAFSAFPLICSYFFFGHIVAVSLGISLVIVAFAGFWIVRPFSRAGIYAAYETTSKGIGFEQSLKLVHSKLDFLGIGADKLTRSAEFEQALLRVSRAGSPVRLLLSSPDNPILRAVANRASLNPTVYQKRVKESLGRLARLRIDKGFNIEVRFYAATSEKDYQQFRLMFIDERICLVSHTVWDTSDGGSNPQIVLVAKPERRTRQLIAAFSDHFERVWNDNTTQIVDLVKYK